MNVRPILWVSPRRKAVSRQLTSARHLKRLSVSICSCLISSSESVFNLYFLWVNIKILLYFFTFRFMSNELFYSLLIFISVIWGPTKHSHLLYNATQLLSKSYNTVILIGTIIYVISQMFNLHPNTFVFCFSVF